MPTAKKDVSIVKFSFSGMASFVLVVQDDYVVVQEADKEKKNTKKRLSLRVIVKSKRVTNFLKK